MNEKLKPEVRKMVAEECGCHPECLLLWDPNSFTHQWKSLTRTAARLIEELPTVTPADSRRKRLYLYESNTALSSDSVDALERIVAELKGFV